MPKVISLIVPLVLLVLAAACGNTDTPTPTATATVPAIPTSTATQTPSIPSVLDKVLAATPASFADMPLEFSDFAGARTFRGYQGDLSYESLLEFPDYAGLAVPNGLWTLGGEQIGLPRSSRVAFDLGIWY